MSRRLPNQVHHRVSRLMRGGLYPEKLPSFDDNPHRVPRWYKSVLQYPPLPLPSKAPAPRNGYDVTPLVPSVAQGGSRPLVRARVKPEPIYYLEDDIRRQFYRDHPFEAFRPKTLVERQAVNASRPITPLVRHSRKTKLRQALRLVRATKNQTPEMQEEAERLVQELVDAEEEETATTDKDWVRLRQRSRVPSVDEYVCLGTFFCSRSQY